MDSTHTHKSDGSVSKGRIHKFFGEHQAILFSWWTYTQIGHRNMISSSRSQHAVCLCTKQFEFHVVQHIQEWLRNITSTYICYPKNGWSIFSCMNDFRRFRSTAYAKRFINWLARIKRKTKTSKLKKGNSNSNNNNNGSDSGRESQRNGVWQNIKHIDTVTVKSLECA